MSILNVMLFKNHKEGHLKMNMTSYKVDTKGFKARVNYKINGDILSCEISDFFIVNEMLYGIVKYNNRPITAPVNIQNKIKNNIIELRNYAGDITDYIKCLTGNKKKTHAEHHIEDKKEEITNFLKNNHIEYLVHFTPVKNLKSILEHGICSNKYCNEHGIEYIPTDVDRFHGYTDFVSLSVSFPNYKMFYKKRQTMDEDFVVLLIDSSVLNLYGPNERMFSNKNAASNNSKKGGSLANLKQMFERPELREKLGLKENYTTDPQAEILLKGRIPAEYIKEIHFNTLFDYEDAKEYVEEDLLKLGSPMFAKRRDYEFWTSKEHYYGSTTCFCC